MAEPSGAEAPKKPNLSTFVAILAFGLLLLVMIDPAAREGVGDLLDGILSPLIGFNGQHYAWTLFFAGVILIVATTVIRHFLVDWVGMARTQEVMRTYQKELGEARKSNNTYKLKKLMDKQPDIMQLQADMSKSQLKPMLFTMIIVIPLFAWLSTVIYEPVDYTATVDEEATGIFYYDSAIYSAGLARPEDPVSMQALVSGRFVPFNLPGADPGTVRVFDERAATAIATLTPEQALRIDWDAHRLTNLTAGEHTLQVDTGGDAPIVRYGGDQTTRTTLAVIVPNDGGEVRVLKLTSARETVTVGEGGAVLYAVAPAPVAGAEGSTRVLVETVGEAEGRVFETGLVTFPDAGRHVVPHGISMPWNQHWDLLHKGRLGNYATLPHWILLYSLFTIPFGQMTQKLLKLLEYRHAVEEHQL